jgi:hypothetical protein
MVAYHLNMNEPAALARNRCRGMTNEQLAPSVGGEQSSLLNHSLAAAILAALALSCDAADWPQFRGPQACGVDAGKSLPVEWNLKTGQNVRWQTPLPGLAHASPIISGDHIFVATAVGPGDVELKVGLYGDIEPVKEKGVHQWRLLALERSSGKVLWNVPGFEGTPRIPRHPKSSHCNSTPATGWPSHRSNLCRDCSASTPTGSFVWKKIWERWIPRHVVPSRNGDSPVHR